MPIRTKKSLNYLVPNLPPVNPITDDGFGLNTRDSETSVTIRVANNVRFGRGVWFQTRPGHTQLGPVLPTGTPAVGMVVWNRTNNSDQLFVASGTEVYYLNTSNVWTGISAAFSASHPVMGTTYPLAGGGGTGYLYMTNGAETVRWTGSAVSKPTATGFPVAPWITFFENHLWFVGVTGSGFNSLAAGFTGLGVDNWSGTFPNQYLYFPEPLLGSIGFEGSTQIFFGKQNLYRLTNYDYSGADTTPFELIVNSYGTLSMNTVKKIGSWVYYQSPDGQIRRTNGYYVEDAPVSDEISPTMAQFSNSSLTNASAGFYDDYYYLSNQSPEGVVNDRITVMDVRGTNKKFSVDTGKYAGYFATSRDSSGIPSLYFTDSRTSSPYVYQSDASGSDNGVAIDMEVQTGIFLSGQGYFRSKLENIIYQGESTGNWNVTFGVAKMTNNDSYLNQDVSLDSGSGYWGDGRLFLENNPLKWGGVTNIEKRIHARLSDRGFSYRIAHSGVEEPVKVLAIIPSVQITRDII